MPDRQHKIQKKLLKQRYKLENKGLNPELQADPAASPSLYVRFAESIRRILYIIPAVSILAAVVMGQSGRTLTLEDIIDSLIIATLGKILLVVIAIALFIYGLKTLRIIK